MIFGKLFRPSNSLLLVYDHVTDEVLKQLEETLLEVGRVYTFLKLSELVEMHKRGKAQGYASVSFENARKSVFLRALPRLFEKEIPATVFLRPECIGLNRLPAEEELDYYQAFYEEKFSETSCREWKARIWSEPEKVNAFLLECRTRLGPLPIEKIDPMLFMETWGKIQEKSPEFVEFGLHLSSSPAHQEHLARDMKFIQKQTGRFSRCAYCSHTLNALPMVGLDCVVTARRGVIERETPVFDLPQWVPE